MIFVSGILGNFHIVSFYELLQFLARDDLMFTSSDGRQLSKYTMFTYEARSLPKF